MFTYLLKKVMSCNSHQLKLLPFFIYWVGGAYQQWRKLRKRIVYLPVRLQCHYLKCAYLLLHGPIKKDWQACGAICNTLLILFKSWRWLLSPCPTAGLAQWLCWKESPLSALSACEHGLTFPKQFPFPTQFYSILYRALFHKGAFQQCPATTGRTAE